MPMDNWSDFGEVVSVTYGGGLAKWCLHAIVSLLPTSAAPALAGLINIAFVLLICFQVFVLIEESWPARLFSFFPSKPLWQSSTELLRLALMWFAIPYDVFMIGHWLWGSMILLGLLGAMGLIWWASVSVAERYGRRANCDTFHVGLPLTVFVGPIVLTCGQWVALGLTQLDIIPADAKHTFSTLASFICILYFTCYGLGTVGLPVIAREEYRRGHPRLSALAILALPFNLFLSSLALPVGPQAAIELLGLVYVSSICAALLWWCGERGWLKYGGSHEYMVATTTTIMLVVGELYADELSARRLIPSVWLPESVTVWSLRGGGFVQMVCHPILGGAELGQLASGFAASTAALLGSLLSLLSLACFVFAICCVREVWMDQRSVRWRVVFFVLYGLAFARIAVYSPPFLYALCVDLPSWLWGHLNPFVLSEGAMVSYTLGTLTLLGAPASAGLIVFMPGSNVPWRLVRAISVALVGLVMLASNPSFLAPAHLTAAKALRAAAEWSEAAAGVDLPPAIVTSRKFRAELEGHWKMLLREEQSVARVAGSDTELAAATVHLANAIKEVQRKTAANQLAELEGEVTARQKEALEAQRKDLEGAKMRLEKEKQEAIRKLEETKAQHKKEMEEVEADKAAKAAKVEELRIEIKKLEDSADDTSLVRVAEMKAELETARREKEAAEQRLEYVLNKEVDESALMKLNAIQDQLQNIEGKIQENHEEEMSVLKRIEEKTDQLAVQVGRTVRTLTFMAEGETDVPQLVVSTPLLADPEAPRPMFSESAFLYFVCAYDGSNVTKAPIKIAGEQGYVNEMLIDIAPYLKMSLQAVAMIARFTPAAAAVSAGMSALGADALGESLTQLTGQVDKVLPLVKYSAEEAFKDTLNVSGMASKVATGLLKEVSGISLKDYSVESVLRKAIDFSQVKDDKVGEDTRAIFAAAQSLTGPAFQQVKALADKQGVTTKLKSLMRRVVDADGSIAWVKNENVEQFLARGKGAKAIPLEGPKGKMGFMSRVGAAVEVLAGSI